MKTIISLLCVSASLTSPVFAQDDNYEENDSITAAYDIGSRESEWLSSINGYGRQYDNDWFRIDATPGYERLQISCVFDDSEGDIDMHLYDASGNFLASSISSTDNEWIDYIGSESGSYYIRLGFGDAGNTYNLIWDDILAETPDIDLTVTGNDSIPGVLHYNWWFPFGITVRNTGTEQAGEFRVAVYLSADNDITSSDYFLGYIDAPSLQGGESIELDDEFWVGEDLPSGQYYLGFILDEGLQVPESNEGNTWNFTTTCDVRATTIDLTSGSGSITIDGAMVTGETFAISDSVENIGGESSGAFKISYYLRANDGSPDPLETFVGETEISGLAAGAEQAYSVQCLIPASLTPGSYIVIWTIDSEFEIPETDESNNSYRLTNPRNVIGPVQLTISDTMENYTSSRRSYAFTVNSDGSWSWSKSADWITVLDDEQNPQFGVQSFRYTVEENLSENPRSGTITFTAGNITRTHSIFQEGNTMLVNLSTTEHPSVSSPPGQITLGEEFQVGRYLVNTGNAGSGPFYIEWGYKSVGSGPGLGNSLGRTVVQNIPGGTSRVVLEDVTIPTSVSSGSYELTWYIDSDEEVLETDENDNIGSFPGSRNFVEPPNLETFPSSRGFSAVGGMGSFTVSSNISWSWTSSASWVSAPGEALGQSATQNFEYVVSPNASELPRNATLTFIGGGITKLYQISQEGVEVEPSNLEVSGVRFINASRQIEFTFVAKPTITYVVESSSNLQIWSEVRRYVNSNGLVVFMSETQPSGILSRFFRVREE